YDPEIDLRAAPSINPVDSTVPMSEYNGDILLLKRQVILTYWRYRTEPKFHVPATEKGLPPPDHNHLAGYAVLVLVNKPTNMVERRSHHRPPSPCWMASDIHAV